MKNDADISFPAISVDRPGSYNVEPAKFDAAPLSVILPVRTDDFAFYAERLKFRDNCDLTDVSTVLVDDGSPEGVSREIEAFCGERDWQYVFVNTREDKFSSPRARNVGIQVATSEWIFSDDADIIYERDFFQRLLKELAILDETPFNFLTIPAIYLSRSASERISSSGEIDSHIPWLLSRTLTEDSRGNCENNQVVQHFAPASGILAARRKTVLQAGAYDTAFEGWGGEDRDLVFRLLQLNPYLVKPREFEVTKNWNLNDTCQYEGWRALYRLVGDYMARKGFYAFHQYHDRNVWRADAGAKANLKLAAEKAKSHFAKRKIPSVPSNAEPRDVIIGFNPFLADLRIRETLNNPEIVDDLDSIHPSKYVDELLARPINSVIIWNPYGTKWRLRVYRELLARGITPIVGERGALPDSVYFDKGGLCVESDSYTEDKWNRSLDERQIELASAHIERVRYGENALEKQSERIGARYLRERLGIAETARVLFAPLQLYDDTVTTLFSEEGRSYKDFLGSLERLAVGLPRDWILLYKNHPLTLKKAPIEAGICVDDFHINDLLEACDSVSLFNSGTGLIAQAFRKPVIYYGRCFYAIDGVNWKFETVGRTVELLTALPQPDIEKIIRFYYYLCEEFYSFAKMEAGARRLNEQSMRAVLKHIQYRTVRIPGFEARHFKTEKFDPYYSPLFDIYRHHAIVSRDKEAEAERLDLARTLLVEAREHYASGEYVEAAKGFRGAYEANTAKPNYLRLAAEAYLGAGRRNEALAALAEARTMLPRNKRLLMRYLVVKYPILRPLGAYRFEVSRR